MVGRKIREARKKAGLTQLELAKRLNASNKTICDIENGKRNSSILTIEKIASALNTSVPELFYMEEKVA